MEMSPSVDLIATALAKAQSLLGTAVKDRVNPAFKSKYADLGSVWDACRKALHESDLSVAQTLRSEGAAVTVTTLLLHKSGQWIASPLTLTSRDSSPQGLGSAITYGRRYGLSAILGICADEDDDGQHASAPKKETNAPPPPRPEAPRPEAPAKAAAPAAPAPAPLTDRQRWNVAAALIEKKMGGVSGRAMVEEIRNKFTPAGKTSIPPEKIGEAVVALEKAAKGEA